MIPARVWFIAATRMNSAGNAAACRLADRERALFERLTEHFEGLAVEFRHLIQEENTRLGHRDFAGLRRGPAADQSRVADRVMRGPKRAHSHQGLARLQETHGAIDASGLQTLGRGRRGRGRITDTVGFQ